MKNNYKKYIYTFFAFIAFVVVNAQVVFHETFGTSTTRTSSQYVPQAGNDVNLGFSTFTCSSFYKPANELYTEANKPTCTSNDLDYYNQQIRNISDGYYVVVDPREKSTPANPTSLDELRNWCVTSSAALGDCGAVLIVNAGELKNQYYRRAATLKRNTSYKVSFKVMSSSKNLPNSGLRYRSKIEIQDLLTEQILGMSPPFTTSSHNAWEVKEYRFRTPDVSSCSTSYAISMRNDNPVNSGNDFYIDDIILEEIVDYSAPVLDCNSSTINQIGANDNRFAFERGRNFNILSNDIYVQNNATVPVVVSGANANATISTVGNWPAGYSISANGELVIAANAVYTPSLNYKITSLTDPTKTSTATIYLITSVDLSVNLTVTNPFVFYDNTTSSSHTYTLKIKNEGSQSISLSSTNQVSIAVPRAIGATGGFTDLDDSLITWTTDYQGTRDNWYYRRTATYDYTFKYPNSGSVTLAPGEERMISFSRNYSISVNSERSITATLTYANDLNSSNNTSTALIQRLNLPYPGTIGPLNTNVCKNGSISLSNTESAAGQAIIYSWEFSTDGGITWNRYGDTQQTEGEETTETNRSTITISNLQKSMLVRRKVHQAGYASSRFNYSNIVSINIVKPELLFDGKGLNDNPRGRNGIAKVQGSEVVFPTLSIRNTLGVSNAAGTITVKDELGNVVAISTNGSLTIPNRTFNQKGFYKYSIEFTESTTLACSLIEYFNVTIYEPADCSKYTEKVFATINHPLLSSEIDGITHGALAVDRDLSTKSTITAAITALGLGPRQKILFNIVDFPGVTGAPIKKGTTVKIKLGQEYSGLNLAGGISLYPLQSNGNRIAGHIQAVEGALLDLLVGDNIFEYSYVAPVDLYGVEVYVGGLLGVAVNASLYGVYIEREKTISENSTNHCFGNEQIAGAALPSPTTIYNNVDTGRPITFNPDAPIQLNETVADVCWGVQDVGLGVATALASVVYPYLAVDDSYETYAIFNKTVAALNRQFLDVKFNQLGRQGDQIQILLSNSGIDILSLNLLADFKAQRYLGDTPVGDEISLNNTAFVKLSLVWVDGRRRAAIIVPSDIPFDRVRITYFSLVQVSLGDYTYIHDVSLLPLMRFEGFGELESTPTICAAEPLLVEKLEACTDYQLSFAYKNNENQFIDISNSTIPYETQLVSINGRDYFRYNFNTLYNQYETLYFKVQSIRKGCLFGDPQYIQVNLTNCNAGIVNPVLRTTAK